MEDKCKLSTIFMHALYISNIEHRKENPLRSYLSVLGMSLKSLLGKRLPVQEKGNQQLIKFFAKFYSDTSWVLDSLLLVT